MMKRTLEAIRSVLTGLEVSVTEMAVNCHHNYIRRENHYGANVWVTRKGAVSAREGELGIIPGSMGRPPTLLEVRGVRIASVLALTVRVGACLGGRLVGRSLWSSIKLRSRAYRPAWILECWTKVQRLTRISIR